MQFLPMKNDVHISCLIPQRREKTELAERQDEKYSSLDPCPNVILCS